MSNLSINNLEYSYNGKPILKDLSLQVKDNEIVCLLGASGCGKTTTLKAIAGLLKPSKGDISIAQVAVNGDSLYVPPQERNIGMMFQDYALFPHLTVEQNIAFGLHKESSSVRNERVKEMLSLIKLEAFAERYPHQLSGGQQQRVAIARALAYKPSLLLLDEPFSNIDHQVRFQLIDDIRRIIKDQQVSAIFVTHSKEEAFAFADKLAIMEEGKIAQLGTAEALYRKPATKGVAAFLSAGIFIDAEATSSTEFKTEFGTITSLEPVTNDQNEVSGKGCIYLKPQYLTLSENEQGVGEFVASRFVGNRYLCRVKLGQQELEIPCAQHQRYAYGQRLAIDVRPHLVNYFAYTNNN
ncbi:MULTISPECIES: ABC transporter ATP-binding protein [Pseudoalteromonas]|uniref:ABC transporter ATP-binding protein n=1 Tax=Pseudoalteromonas TaxID=53246 RepID=UPI00026C9185|nr:ABC transporter ATP-binding protein [Pseudoalteromonas spongiae]ATC99317.1 iron(III) transport system ATP-binding protein [Pseudoalteromonas spongiae UST010723-006]